MAGSRNTASGWFVAALLIAFSASGLMAGLVTRQLGSFSLGASPTVPAASFPTSTATTSAAGAFNLKVQLAPNPARVAQPVQLTVTAFTSSSTAVANVRCTLLQTPNAPTFDPWPGALTTDTTGQARWILSLDSQTPPGSYQVYVQGDSASYHGRWFGTLVVAG
jgi:hypothetical protein